METLTAKEVGIIIDALQMARRKIEDYADYPSYEFKLQRINEVTAIIDKLRGAA